MPSRINYNPSADSYGRIEPLTEPDMASEPETPLTQAERLAVWRAWTFAGAGLGDSGTPSARIRASLKPDAVAVEEVARLTNRERAAIRHYYLADHQNTIGRYVLNAIAACPAYVPPPAPTVFADDEDDSNPFG